MNRLSLAALSMLLIVAGTVRAADPPAGLVKELAVFEPLVGKSFRGEFPESTKDKPMIDIQVWERALNGRAVRLLHSINDGVYGGETIFMWDAEQKKIAYWYFTTAGFTTKGTLEVDGNQWTSLEEVSGNANGITKVRATTVLNEDETILVKSEYFAADKWSPGNQRTYKLAEGAQAKFK